MSTDVFLIGLGCLVVVAGLIVALSSKKRADDKPREFNARDATRLRRDSSRS
ncbi:hypothetical protein [Allosediminivita pacifica]|uniref:Uncharacterized protein n=1 Tax=Allosediminivita pacifica TaxID=1267769 RepID=A0A2T6AVB6_9RHOB|nr:hypothetical protein [Allosediminivita pacifica]PTX47686.1 hypothetical protein C8N44_11114 [Allosediminivita pacifica]